nr:hypothetical protein Iba_chr01dCG15600 [Ipomoea batatas]
MGTSDFTDAAYAGGGYRRSTHDSGHVDSATARLRISVCIHSHPIQSSHFFSLYTVTRPGLDPREHMSFQIDVRFFISTSRQFSPKFSLPQSY